MTTDISQQQSRTRPEAWSRGAVAKEDSILLRVPSVRVEPCRVTPRLAFYGRRSRRVEEGVSLSRQIETMFVRGRELGGVWDESRDVYIDDDISAKGGAFRPEMEELLKNLLAGRYDGVVVWDVTRWVRNKAENRLIMNVLESAGVELYFCVEKHLHVHGPMSIGVEMAADTAAQEVHKTSLRTSGWQAQMAAHGAVTSKAPFGMKKKKAPSPFPERKKPIRRLVPDDKPRKRYGMRSRADLVRELFERAVAGETLMGIANAWNEKGWLNDSDQEWTTGRLHRMLHNPRYAGFSTISKQIVHDSDGRPIAPYTPVVEPAVFFRIRDAKQTYAPRSGAATDSALRGLLRCGSCGKTMVQADGGPRDRSQVRSYRCTPSMSTACTRRCKVVADRVEDAVFEAVARLLSDPVSLARHQANEVQEDYVRRQAAERRLAAVNEALENLDREHFRPGGGFSDPGGAQRYSRLKQELMGEAATLVRQSRPPSTLPETFLDAAETLGSVRAALQSLPKSQRLKVYKLLIESVRVDSGKAGRGFDLGRLSINWRED
ncbi:recombinase family protein [Phycicoccus jejuensis]|uniref:recombinase family protein n=1 Tax=Phycicoccus jejuensis TaxID=367299 RepID=UPI0004C45783|nr:recombinase family protein [Phycicoccus jejuensis]